MNHILTRFINIWFRITYLQRSNSLWDFGWTGVSRISFVKRWYPNLRLVLSLAQWVPVHISSTRVTLYQSNLAKIYRLVGNEPAFLPESGRALTTICLLASHKHGQLLARFSTKMWHPLPRLPKNISKVTKWYKMSERWFRMCCIFRNIPYIILSYLLYLV